MSVAWIPCLTVFVLLQPPAKKRGNPGVRGYVGEGAAMSNKLVGVSKHPGLV